MGSCSDCKHQHVSPHELPCSWCTVAVDTPGFEPKEVIVKAPLVSRPIALDAAALFPGASPGRKDDGGKAPWGLLMRGCSLALAGVVAVLKFGANKYAADSWQNVENAEERYKDALYRHLHSIETRGFLAKDPETGLLEWFHVACNALFLATFAAKRATAEAERETH